jgi:hypothetical protein
VLGASLIALYFVPALYAAIRRHALGGASPTRPGPLAAGWARIRSAAAAAPRS